MQEHGKALDAVAAVRLETKRMYSEKFMALAQKHAVLFSFPQFEALVAKLKTFKIIE